MDNTEHEVTEDTNLPTAGVGNNYSIDWARQDALQKAIDHTRYSSGYLHPDGDSVVNLARKFYNFINDYNDSVSEK